MKQRVNSYIKKLQNSKLYTLARLHPRRTEMLLVNLFFGSLAALFMGPILFHFGSAVHGFWGDGTGGLIWFNNLHFGPFGGATDTVIYPYGDNLFRPDLITAFLYIVPYWLISTVMGGIAAWNFIIFASFWLCGVGMYYLIKRFVGNRKAAVWAGVAFAYLPMHQYKAFGHIAYVLSFVFVFVLWQVLNFAEKPTKRNALLLGLAFAAPFYIDGYYVLFTLILVGVPLMFLAVQQVVGLRKQTVQQYKSFFISLGVFLGTAFVLLLPIIAVKLLYGAQIAAGLALARGDFMSNVIVYTARWYDFVIPIETHPVFGHWATAFRVAHNHGSNTSEQTLYVGFVVLGLVAWTTYYFWKRRKDPKALQQVTPVKAETVLMLLLTAFVAFVITLPPFFHLFGHRIPMPSGVISVLVQYWRVYARLIIIIQFLLVIVAAIGLAILLGRINRRVAAWGMVALLVAVTFFEYLSFNPFHRQDIWYYDKLSSSDRWLAQQDDIQVIAVYPLVDQPDGLASLYTTEQVVHGKKMINSGTITTKEARLRASISGLNDPQTLGVLKALGAQAVMTHEIGNDRTVAGLKLAYGANEAPAGYAADVDVFHITNAVAPAKYALVADTGFKDMRYADLTTRHYITGGGEGDVRVERMPGVAASTGMRHISFDLAATDGYGGNDIVVMQGDKVVDTIHVAAGQKETRQYDMREDESLRLVVAGQLKEDTLYMGRLSAE